MLEQQRFRGDGPDATGAEQFRESDQQVNREKYQFAHGCNATTLAIRASLHGNGDSR